MRKSCLDEGGVQAYLDGELTRDEAAEAASHLASCAACAAALAAAEGETAFFAAAFAPDETIGVPSESLRARVNAAVARSESAHKTEAAKNPGRAFIPLFAGFKSLFAFTPARAAAFASLFAVVAFALVFAVLQKQGAGERPAGEAGEIAALREAAAAPSAAGEGPEAAGPKVEGKGEGNVDGKGGANVVPVKFDKPAGGGLSKANGGRSLRHSAQPSGVKTAAAAAAPALLPGEKNYQEAIASLTKAVGLGGDAVMNPKARFDYERSLAVLDRAIADTRRAALRDPKDKDAVGFLMTAYQSKVDLLTIVADQAQVAALGR